MWKLRIKGRGLSSFGKDDAEAPRHNELRVQRGVTVSD